jgi:hypothetical protein
MPLSQDALRSPLAALFNGTGGYPADAHAAATAWANAYGGYAASATAVATLPVPADVATATTNLATSLGNAFINALGASPPYYPTLVTAMVTAFGVFWPPVHFLGPGVVGVAVSPPPLALTNALTAFFVAGNASGSRPSGDSQASSLATVLDVWTKTILVTNTPATGTPSTVPLA